MKTVAVVYVLCAMYLLSIALDSEAPLNALKIAFMYPLVIFAPIFVIVAIPPVCKLVERRMKNACTKK